jgi:hypothetical protein
MLQGFVCIPLTATFFAKQGSATEMAADEDIALGIREVKVSAGGGLMKETQHSAKPSPARRQAHSPELCTWCRIAQNGPTAI